MKKHLFGFMLLLTSLIFAKDGTDKRINKLIAPYLQAIDFMVKLDQNRAISNNDVWMFFNSNGLNQKKDLKKLKAVVRTLQKLTYKKKSLIAMRSEIESLIESLQRVQDFIVDYAATYYIFMTYSEIAGFYNLIDERDASIIGGIIAQPEKFGLPEMQGRGLYKFVKKIDLDLRRITALTIQNIVSDETAVLINQLKTKLTVLRLKIVVNPFYKAQLKKTRIMKALGVILLGVCMRDLYIHYNSLMWPAIVVAVPLFIIRLGIAIKELRESSKYNIPIHSKSFFSGFTPKFSLLTWIPRG